MWYYKMAKKQQEAITNYKETRFNIRKAGLKCLASGVMSVGFVGMSAFMAHEAVVNPIDTKMTVSGLLLSAQAIFLSGFYAKVSIDKYKEFKEEKFNLILNDITCEKLCVKQKD